MSTLIEDYFDYLETENKDQRMSIQFILNHKDMDDIIIEEHIIQELLNTQEYIGILLDKHTF